MLNGILHSILRVYTNIAGKRELQFIVTVPLILLKKLIYMWYLVTISLRRSVVDVYNGIKLIENNFY